MRIQGLSTSKFKETSTQPLADVTNLAKTFLVSQNERETKKKKSAADIMSDLKKAETSNIQQRKCSKREKCVLYNKREPTKKLNVC